MGFSAEGPAKDSGNVSNLRTATVIAVMVATVGVAAAQDYADIRLPNKLVARIRTGGPYGSISSREAEIYQRITEALSNELDNIFDEEIGGPDLDVYEVDGVWTLSIGDQMLIQAFEEDAVGAGTTTRELIYQWKANYAQQLPRAVSPIKVPQWYKEQHPDAGADYEKKMHDLPREDAVLVREVAEILEEARNMPDARFEALLPTMEKALLQRIWTYRHPACGAPPVTEHIRAQSALKRARGLSEEQYAAEKWWMAGLTIKKLRNAMDVPKGVGPVPEQRDLPDFQAPIPPEGGTEPETVATQPQEPRIPEPQLAEGTALARVAIGTGLDRNNTLLNVGQEFPSDTSQLLVYLQVEGARQNTIVGVTLEKEDAIVARRLVRVSGDRRMAVTFYPGRHTTFAPGEYDVRLTVNGRDAGFVPFRIRPAVGTLTGG